MFFRLFNKSLFSIVGRQLIKLPTFSLQLRLASKEYGLKFFQFNSTQSLQFLKTFRLLGLLSGSGFFFARKAFCKSVLARTNPLVIRNNNSDITWREFWSIIGPYFHWLIAAALGALIVALLNVQIPILLGRLVNIIASFLAKDSVPDFSRLKPIGAQLFGFYIGQAFFTFFYITCLSVMGERIAADLRTRLFGHLLHFDMTFYDGQMSGELSDRLNFDVQEFKSCFKSCVAQGLRTFTQTAGCIISLYLISPKMTFLTVAVIPLVIAIGSIFGSVLRRVSNAAQSQSAFAMAIANEAFGNIRTVKEFAMEKAEQNLYKKQVEKARRLNETLGLGIGIFQAGTNICLNGLLLGILYGGARMIADSNILPGDLMSFLVTSQTIQRSLTQLSLVFGNAVKGYTSCARINEFLKIYPSNISGDIALSADRLSGRLSLEDVSFAYESRLDHKVVSKLNLVIESGKTVALCGPSGSGKSTIAALIERLYEPESGRIMLDGVDLNRIDPYWLRKYVIGVISQEPVLFATTIEENIRYGKVDATDEEVRNAARMANAHDFVEKFPNGYKTLVGERGVALSGGQKQRIAIARALLKNPPILIFDEATSALDAEGERIVQDALDKLSKNRTMIIIAHRLSTIRNADLICVIKHGKLIEQGKHEELLQKKGAYYKLVSLQQNQSAKVDGN